MPNFEVDIDLPIRAQNGATVNSKRWLAGEHKDLANCLITVRANWPEATIVEVRDMDTKLGGKVVFSG